MPYLKGCGAWHEGRQFFHCSFPSFIQDKGLDINCLELLTIIVACKVWGKSWKGERLVVHCDNLVSVNVINSDRSRDEFPQSCLRELCYISAIHQFEIRGVHIAGIDNRISDTLSRWDLGNRFQQEFWELVGPEPTQETYIYSGLFEFSHIW